MMNARRISSLSALFLILTALPHLLRAQTAVTLSTSPNPSRFGAPVVLSATVTPASATGRVTFYDGVTVLGTKSFVSGAASLSTILLPAGNGKLRAYYAGDASNDAATSNAISQSVNAQPSASLAAGNPLPVTGFGSNSLAVADFNGDGKSDIAVIKNQTLSILLGDGAGNFRVAFNVTSEDPGAVGAAGDFNGDGVTDLVIGNLSFGSVSILLGNGDGTFQPPVNYPIPQGSSYPLRHGVFNVAVADFNGDGKADLVTADAFDGVNILLGNGDGTFQPAVSYLTDPLAFAVGVASQAAFVVVGDFNGDGKADLAAASFSGGAGGSVSILLGNGDGTFQAPAIVAVPSRAFGLAVSDFNGDGKADLATSSSFGGLSVLPGNGDGTFQTPVRYATGAMSVAVGDFNGDGKTDLVFGDPLAFIYPLAGLIRVLAGNGDGTFQPPAAYPAAIGAPPFLVGDFNGDGRTDLAVAGGILLGTTLSVTTSGTPQSTIINTAFPSPLQVTVKDGVNPLSGVTVTFPEPGARGATLSSDTAITDANGVASVTATAGYGTGSYTVAATALGLPALFSLTNLPVPAAAITASPNVPESTLLGTAFARPLQVTITNSDGLLSRGVTVAFTAPASGASAILSAGTAVTNDAGVASVTATANNTAGSYKVTASAGGLSATFSLTNLQPAAVTLATSTNPSNLGSPVTLTATVANPSATGRVTFFDGVAILGTKPAPAGVASFSTVLLSAGTHRLTASYRDDANFIAGTSNVLPQTVKAAAGGAFIPQTPVAAAPAGLSVAVGDFNHDGKVDVAFPRFIAGFADAVTVLLGKGDGTFQAPVDYAIGPGGNATSIVAADFNGDGITDLATSGGAILFGKGDGTFRPAVNNTSAGSSFAVGDFNGDGKPDIIYAFVQQEFFPSVFSPEIRPSPRDGGFYYVLNVNLQLGNGDGTFGSPIPYATLPASSSTVVAGLLVADFNGDGKPDVVVLLNDSGPYISLGNGDGTGQAPARITVTGLSAAPSLVSGDFNGDGKTDLAVGGVSSTFILLGKGDGTFQPAVSYPFGTAVTSGDFNGDGFTDLVVADASGNTVGILYGKGDGTFQQGLAFSAGATLAVTDFNGDGKADILTANAANGTIIAWLGAAPSSLTITPTGGVSQSATIGSPFPMPLQVTLMMNGVPVSGATVTFTVPTTGASAILSSLTAVTNASGVASVTATANNIWGSYTVTASVGAASTSFSLTNLPGPGSNLAFGKPATQSSTLAGYDPSDGAQSAVDGNTDGAFFNRSVTATNLETNPWWQVDLGAPVSLNSIVVWNRTDACCVNRLADYWVFASNTPFLPTDTPTTLQNRAGTVSIHQTSAPNPSTTIRFEAILVQARYIRVQLTGTDYLSLAEVQVFGTGGTPPPTNVALGKTATQSSTFPGYASDGAAAAVDGNTDGNFGDGSVTATNADPNAWWQVDLGASATVSSMVVWNRTDCCGSRLGDYWVFVSDIPFLATDTPATVQNRPGTFSSHQTTAPNPSTTIAAVGQGRYVRVQLTGTDYLSLAEVQVFGAGGAPAPTNVALGKAASQSSTFPGYATDGASSAVDGNTDGNFFDGSVTATNLDPSPWWQVDLGASTAVSSVVIWNRTDCCGSRLSDYWVFVSDTPFLATDTPATLQSRAGTFISHQTATPKPSTTIAAAAQGRYVRVQLTGANYLSLAEVQVFGQ